MCGYRTRLCMKLLPDEFAPQRGEHVCVADAGLLAIPGSLQAALFEVGLGVPAELIPADRDCDREKSEWDGLLDGFLDAISGVADAVVLGLLVDGLDHPAPVVAFDGLCGGGGGVGGGDRDVEVFGAVRVADQGDLERTCVKWLVPEAGELVDERGARAPVAPCESDGCEGRGLGDLSEASHPFALQRRAAVLVCSACWWELVDRGVCAHSGGQVDVGGQPLPGSGGVGAVHRELDRPAGEVLDDDVDELSSELGLGGPVGVLIVLRTKQPEEDGQADHPPARAWQRYDEHDHDPAVPEAGALPRALWLRSVVQVVRAVYALSRAPEERVVDGQADWRAGRHEHRDQQLQELDAELVGIPAAVREEGVRAAVMPHAREPGGLEHSCDGVLADTGDEPDGQHAERPIARCGEARREQGKQTGERTGYRDHGGDLLGGKGRAAIMRPTAFCLLGAHRSGSPPTLLPGRLTRGHQGAHPSRAPAAVRPPAGGRQRSSHRAAAALMRARDTNRRPAERPARAGPNGSPLDFSGGGGYGGFRGGATGPPETDGAERSG